MQSPFKLYSLPATCSFGATDQQNVALATCDPGDLWGGSAPLHSRGIYPDETKYNINRFFTRQDSGEQFLPSPISDYSTPSQNSLMDFSHSIDSMFFPQARVVDDRYCTMDAQPINYNAAPAMKISNSVRYVTILATADIELNWIRSGKKHLAVALSRSRVINKC